MIVGYVRVSSFEQNEERQFNELKDFGVEKFFSEKISARAKVRPQFEEMMRFLREGDILVVSEFSRLARSTADLLKIVEFLNQKGVEVKSLKEQLDTSTPQGKFMLTIFGAIAEFERDLLLQRQREGIKIAQAAGKYKGRHEKKPPNDFDDYKKLWHDHNIKVSEIARRFKVCRSTVYKWLRQK